MKKVLIIVVIAIVAIIVCSTLYKGTSAYIKDAYWRSFLEEVIILVDGLEKYAKDNNGIYPVSFIDKSSVKGKTLNEYLLRPLEQSYSESSKNVDLFVSFINDTIPSSFDKQWRPGKILVYIHSNTYTVFAFGYKDQQIIRSDSETFKELYKTYIQKYREMYKKS